MKRINVSLAAFAIAAGGAWAEPGAGASATGATASAARAVTPLERGTYLAGICGCVGCHTPWGEHGRDVAKLYGGSLPRPGDKMAQGTPNITPDRKTGIGKWTDEHIMAAIREGKRPDGGKLSPRMPCGAYHGLTDDDAKALVVFLRSQKPVSQKIPRRKPTVEEAAKLLNLPSAAGNVDLVADPAKHGEYLSGPLRCMGCHTPHDGPLKGTAYAGGNEFKTNWGPDGKPVYSSNITSDPETGVGKWTVAQVADAVRELRRPDGTRIQGPMNFHKDDYALLTDADAAALGAFVKSIPPVRNKVPTAPAAPAPVKAD